MSPDLITSPAQLPARLGPQPEKIGPAVAAFAMRISDHFAALLQRYGDPLARQVIPDPAELDDPRSDSDPLAEEAHSPAPLIIHRYPGRVVFLVSNRCAIHCRFCMRKRKVGPGERIDPQSMASGLDYIRRTPQISEVILSGGDPLMLPDGELIDILVALKSIAHIRILRLHTRIPGAWPQRVTPALARALAQFHPLLINIHFNHPDEITPEASRACARLADAGLPLGSQTVLLKGINDEARILQALLERLLAIRVRPYYLHQVDRVAGSAHFLVPIDKGLRLMAASRGRLSGTAMPHFMIDLPAGGGKMELLPQAIIDKSSDHWMIRNFEGRAVRYPLY